MKKAVFFLCLVGMVALWPRPTSTVSAQQDANLQDYETIAFSMKLPAGWVTEEVDLGSGMYIAATPVDLPLTYENIVDFEYENDIWVDHIRTQPVLGMLAIDANEFEDEPLEPQEVMEELIDDFDFDILRTERSRPITIDTATGVEFLAYVNGQEQLAGRVFGIHAVLVQNSDWVLLMAIGGPVDVFEANRDLFGQVLTSPVFKSGMGPEVIQAVAPAGVEFATFDAGYYTIQYPSGWNVNTVETFDGSLAVFSPADIPLTNADLEDLGYQDAPNNQQLIGAILSGQPVAGVLVVDVEAYYYWDDADYYMEYPIELLDDLDIEVVNVNRARPVIVGSFLANEIFATVEGQRNLAGNEISGNSIMIQSGDYLLIFVGGAFSDVYEQNEDVLIYMARSLNVR